jgi:transcription termination factor Rho
VGPPGESLAARPSPPRRRGGRGRGRGRAEGEEPEQEEPDRTVEGMVELLANGSGFVRVSPPDPSDDDRASRWPVRTRR